MSYTHLTRDERYVIDHLRRFGLSLRQIGRRLGRSAGTLSRELGRNAAPGLIGYCNDLAHDQARARQHRPRGPRKMRRPELAAYVQAKLRQRWSPQQIAQRLRRDHPRNRALRMSHEAIYLWVYLQGDPWTRQLRRRHRRRRPQRPGTAGKQGRIVGRVGIEQRPAVVAGRSRFGDWESDTLEGAKGRGALATHVERKSRYLLAARLADKTARRFARRSLAAFGAMPRNLCKTLTADNGKEMAGFKLLEAGLGLRVYFARPYAAWERGTCENTNGLLRDYFPKGTDFRRVSDRRVAKVVRSLNNRPRKCLGYQTPAEVLSRLRGVALQI